MALAIRPDVLDGDDDDDLFARARRGRAALREIEAELAAELFTAHRRLVDFVDGVATLGVLLEEQTLIRSRDGSVSGPP